MTDFMGPVTFPSGPGAGGGCAGRRDGARRGRSRFGRRRTHDACAGLRYFPDLLLAGGRRLREPLADTARAVSGNQRPRASPRAPRRRHSGRVETVREGRCPCVSRRPGWPPGYPAGRQPGRCLGPVRRLAGERNQPRIPAAGGHVRLPSGHTQGARGRYRERPAGATGTAAPRRPWPSSATSQRPKNDASCSASLPRRRRTTDKTRGGHARTRSTI